MVKSKTERFSRRLENLFSFNIHNDLTRVTAEVRGAEGKSGTVEIADCGFGIVRNERHHRRDAKDAEKSGCRETRMRVSQEIPDCGMYHRRRA